MIKHVGDGKNIKRVNQKIFEGKEENLDLIRFIRLTDAVPRL